MKRETRRDVTSGTIINNNNLFYTNEKDMNKNLVALITFLVILVIWTSNSYATQIESEELKINNLYFSMLPLDNWTYSESNDSPAARILGFGPINSVSLTPSQFSNFLLDLNRTLYEKMQNEGAYSTFGKDVDFRLKNAPLETYVKYNMDRQSGIKVVSQRNVAIDGEKAIKIYADGILTFNGIKFVEYMAIHNADPYYIGFMANSKDYEKYLPQFEQMVKSFKFVN